MVSVHLSHDIKNLLSKEQLELLASWDSCRDSQKILETLLSIYPEFLRLNNVLSAKIAIPEKRELCVRVFEMIL